MSTQWRQDGQEVWLYCPEYPYSLKFLAGKLTGAACILIADDKTISNDLQNQISMDVVLSECEWVACMGYACSSWDDSLDWAYLEFTNYKCESDEVFLTTWHENDTLTDVVEFLLGCTGSSDEPFDRIVVILLGSDNYSVAGVKRSITELLSY